MSAAETSPAAKNTAVPRFVPLRGADTPTPTNLPASPGRRPSAWDQAPEPARLVADPMHQALVPDQATAAAIQTPISMTRVPLSSQIDLGQSQTAIHRVCAEVADFPDGQQVHGTHHWLAVGDQIPPVQSIDESVSNDPAVGLADPLLALLADTLNDLEKVRIAQENRLRQLTRDVEDKDGEVRGFGLDERNPQVAKLSGTVEAMGKLEHEAVLNLQRRLRQHPLGPWVKQQKGIGEKQAARLLAAIGDPYWNDLHQRPRTVSELWAFCGLHVFPDEGVAAHRRKGVQANWSTTAKTRAYLIATSCIKQLNSPYRSAYQHRRDRTAHTHPEWTPLHAHNDALRITAKTILKDLWRAAKQCHEETP